MRPQDKRCVNWWRSRRGSNYKRIRQVVTKGGVSQGIIVEEKGFGTVGLSVAPDRSCASGARGL